MGASPLTTVVSTIPRARHWPTVAVLATILLGAMPVQGAPAADSESPIWLISTRHLSGCSLASGGEPEFWEYTAEGAWRNSDRAAFFRQTRGLPTVIFVHGNRVTANEAVHEGWALRKALVEGAGSRAFRFAIWSWPSERTDSRHRADAQAKAARGLQESHPMARLLEEMPSGVPLSLIGYSFGARTILGALETHARGASATTPRPQAGPRAAPLRVVLVAAAADRGSLAPCGSDRQALGQVDRMLITVNSLDPALKWYRRLYGRRGPDALGFVGVGCASVGPDAEKLEMLSLGCEVGKDHSWMRYLSAPSLRARLPGYAGFETPGDGSGARAAEPREPAAAAGGASVP